MAVACGSRSFLETSDKISAPVSVGCRSR